MDNIQLKLLGILIESLDDDEEIDKGIKIEDIAHSTIVSLGVKAVEPLTDYLEKNKGIRNRDKNQAVANILLDICKIYRNEVPLRIFEEAVDNKASEFRLEAIRALGYIGNENSYEKIMNILEDPEETAIFKSNAILSFGDLWPKHGEESHLEIIDELMKNIPNNPDRENKTLKNNIIYVISNLIDKDSSATIGEFIFRNKS